MNALKQRESRKKTVGCLQPEIVKKEWIEGSACPNCLKGILKSSMPVKSDYEARYHYVLSCDKCNFKYLKKVAVTGSGRVRQTGFTDAEFKKAQKLMRL
jgi:hypothetical protein